MLAIVIPFFNQEFFEETLYSLANQTNKDFTVYIGDDASPFEPAVLIDKFRSSLKIEYKKFEKNLGGTSLVQHWKRCINLTSDEKWLMILGDDDKLEKGLVESWYFHYKEFNGKSNVVRFASTFFYEEISSSSNIYLHPKWELAENSLIRKMEGTTRSSLSEYIFLKEKYEEIGFFDYPLGWYSDDRAWLEFSGSKPIYTINDSCVQIRKSTKSISGDKTNYSLKNESASLFYKFLIQEKLDSFKKPKRNIILRTFEVVTLQVRPLFFREWISLGILHVKNFTYPTFMKFLKLFIKNVNRR